MTFYFNSKSNLSLLSKYVGCSCQILFKVKFINVPFVQTKEQLDINERDKKQILFIMQEVSLYLTSLNKLRSEPLAVFTIPALSTNWNKLGIMVRGSNVKLFINCEHVETLSVTRPQTIEFDPASSLYIGQGGSNFKKPWEGIIQVCNSLFLF